MEKRQRDEALMKAAEDMMARAYAPYSHFHVGAALLGRSGRIYTGCNVENASYGATICAERTAVFKAVSEGEREFEAIAIAGGPDGVLGNGSAPCGICRQVLYEFCDPESFEVMVLQAGGEVKRFRLGELMPEGFGPRDLA